MQLRFCPAAFRGVFSAPPSKSLSHRALILADASARQTELISLSDCEDVSATARGLSALHAAGAVDCRDSASTLRFLIPYAASMGINAFFTCSEQLSARPVSLYAKLFRPKDVYVGSRLPLTVSGRLAGGFFELPADVSSQYASGLLLASSAMSEKLTLRIPHTALSLPYVRLTADIMREFGMIAEERSEGSFLYFEVPGGQKPSLKTYRVEGDWSNGAFYLCLAVLLADNKGVLVQNLNDESSQGDRRILSVLKKSGADIRIEAEGFRVFPSRLSPFSHALSDTPDLFPLLAAMAAFCPGISRFSGVEGLIVKESDRIFAMSTLLTAFGVHSEYKDGVFSVFGGNPNKTDADPLACAGDHRIAMAAALLSLGSRSDCVLDGAECIRKSWPSLWQELAGAGLCQEVLHD